MSVASTKRLEGKVAIGTGASRRAPFRRWRLPSEEGDSLGRS